MSYHEPVNIKIEGLIKSLVEITHSNERLILKLDLSVQNINFLGIITLASVKDLGKIKELSLSKISIDIEGVRALAESRNLQGLKHLDLGHNNIVMKEIGVLARSLQGLTYLDLSGNKIDINDIVHDNGKQFLTNIENIKHFNLRDCKIVNSNNEINSDSDNEIYNEEATFLAEKCYLNQSICKALHP